MTPTMNIPQIIDNIESKLPEDNQQAIADIDEIIEALKQLKQRLQ